MDRVVKKVYLFARKYLSLKKISENVFVSFMIYSDPFIRSGLFHFSLNASLPAFVAVTSHLILLVGSFTSCGFAILHETMIQHKLGTGTYLQANIRF